MIYFLSTAPRQFRKFYCLSNSSDIFIRSLLLSDTFIKRSQQTVPDFACCFSYNVANRGYPNRALPGSKKILRFASNGKQNTDRGPGGAWNSHWVQI